MPNCFTLTPIGESKPASFQAIDEAICAAFGWPVHPKNWAEEWYNVIGIQLAYGRTFDQIVADTQHEPIKQIARWLEQNYTVDAWAELF